MWATAVVKLDRDSVLVVPLIDDRVAAAQYFTDKPAWMTLAGIR